MVEHHASTFGISDNLKMTIWKFETFNFRKVGIYLKTPHFGKLNIHELINN